MTQFAIRKFNDRTFQVAEVSIECGFSGERKYSRSLGSKYKTLKGAEDALKRWMNYFSWQKPQDIGIISEEEYVGELIV